LASSKPKKHKKNTLSLFEAAIGLTLKDLRIAERDRILYLDLSDGKILSIYLYGSQPNLFLLESDVVQEAYKRNDHWVGKSPPSPRQAKEVDVDESLEHRDIAKKLFGSFPSHLLDEVLNQSDPQLESVRKVGTEITSLLNNADRALVYWKDERPIILSLIHLAAFEDLRVEEFESVNKACAIVGGRRLKNRSFDGLFLPVEKKLTASLAKKQKMLKNLMKAMEAGSRADKYQHWGDLLMSQPHDAKAVRESQLEIADFADPEIKNLISLDPELTLMENAAKYYEKAKRARSKRGHDLSRIPDLEREIKNLEAVIRDLKKVEDEKSLNRFLSKEMDSIEALTGFSLENKKGEPSSRFKKFEISKGYIVLVGKNAKQNDELTLKVSSKEDVWMHARGYPGSHTVLKTAGRNDHPPKSVIEEAASIAAFYSKGKSSSLVPVQYTRRKNVSKPKGAAKGSVRLTKEEVVLVEPRLPN